MRHRPCAIFVWLVAFASGANAAEFNIVDYGAAPNDAADDTPAINKALAACAAAGGGAVFVPAGTFYVARQGAESPILAVPSNTTLYGEGPASTLKFDARVNQSNFWRMLGATTGTTRHVVIRDLRLDGSTTFTRYEKGVPEQNHGIFLAAPEGRIENVQIERLLIENFAGDGVAVGHGCRNVTIRDVALRNFLRQGIQMAGGNGARDYLVTGCHDLEHTIEPGGSTIHVEHARGLVNVQIIANRCRRSILAGGVDGLLVRDNVVTGRIEGNGDRNTVVVGNLVRGAVGNTRALMQFGFADGLIVRDNVVVAGGPGQTGIYVWGTSKYDPAPSRNVLVADNLVDASSTGIMLNGVDGATVSRNRIRTASGQRPTSVSRGRNVVVDDANVAADAPTDKPADTPTEPAVQP